jgi:hypothetical protein
MTQSGALLVSGATELSAGSGDITLRNASNNFGGVVSSRGKNIELTDAVDGLTLGETISNATLAIESSGGAISQDQPYSTIKSIKVVSVSSFTATLGRNPAAINLLNPFNDFGDRVSVLGSTIGLVDADDLRLGTVTTSADLTIRSHGPLDLGTITVGGNLFANSGNGLISQVGVLLVSGNTDLNAGSGDITLNHVANNFVGVVRSLGKDIALADGFGGLTFGKTTAIGSFTISSTGGGIDQQTPYTSDIPIIVSGLSSLLASLGGSPAPIFLPHGGNRFGGAVTTKAAPVQISGLPLSQLAAVVNAPVLVPIVVGGSPGLVQQSQSVTSLLPLPMLGTPGSTGAVAPYPLAMASPSSGTATGGGTSSSSTAGTATASGTASTPTSEGPLRPDFRVESQRADRFSMGQASLVLEPGREVCMASSGCGVTMNSGNPDQPSGANELQINGVSSNLQLPSIQALLKGIIPADQAERPSSLRRLAAWLLSSR